jgi:predicted nucleotidyltransferase
MDMQEDWISELRSWANANNSLIEFWLFGSRAQGCSRPGSDVDIALALAPSKKANDDQAFTNYFFSKDQWKQQLEEIVGSHVSLEIIVPDLPGADWDSMVRCFGVLLWSRGETAKSSSMPLLLLRCARTGSNVEDYDVLADDKPVGRIFLCTAAPEERQWRWTLTYGEHEDRTPTQGSETARPEAMAAFAKSWRREQGRDGCPD